MEVIRLVYLWCIRNCGYDTLQMQTTEARCDALFYYFLDLHCLCTSMNVNYLRLSSARCWRYLRRSHVRGMSTTSLRVCIYYIALEIDSILELFSCSKVHS